MRNGFLVSFAALVLGTKIATAQAPLQVEPSPHRPAPVVREKTDPVPPPTATAQVVPIQDIAPKPSSPGWCAGHDTPCCPGWGNACAPCCPTPCGPPGRFWIGADYLLWWTKTSPVLPLVTTSTAASGGIIGPGTTVLVGGSSIDYEAFSGFRFVLGFWLDEEQTVGLEGGGLFLGSRSKDFGFGGNGAADSPTFGRPFINANSGREDTELVSSPNLLAGTVNVHSTSRLAGGEINGILNVCCGCAYRVDLLGGFRYFQLNDGLGITENLAVLPNVPGIGGNTFAIQDQFDTSNRFYGGQIGARGEIRRGRLFADCTGKIALGAVDEVVDIRGVTVITPAQRAATVTTGGLLALPTNIGHHTRSRFAVLPEGELDVGYQVTDTIRVSIGYNFLYLSNAVRPGDQIDRVLNPNQIPFNGSTGGLVGAPRPAFNFHDTDFWAQGIRFGLEFRY
jgi:hypothetical protein